MKFNLPRVPWCKKKPKKSIVEEDDIEADGDDVHKGSIDSKRSRKFTDTSVKKLSVDDKTKGKKRDDTQNAKDSVKRRNFPCCFYIPLDIAMQGFALLDIIYYSIFALLWATILALEPFAGKDENLAQESSKNTSGLSAYESSANARFLALGEAGLNEILTKSRASAVRSRSRTHSFEEDESINFEDFHETAATFVRVQEIQQDKMNEARVYSRIAHQFKMYGQEIDDGCGRDYYAGFLYANELETTRDLFEQIAGKAIIASLMYAVIGCVLLTTICCFRGYIASKVLIILLWYIQLVPSYLVVLAAVMSQSHRLCILQYGIGKTTRGQRIIFWSLLWPLFSYKPYEIFVWAIYIRGYFNNKDGKLMDESYFSTGKLDERQHKQFAMNPSTAKDDHQHHHRRVARQTLFRHGHRHFHDLDKQENHFQFKKPTIERLSRLLKSDNKRDSSSD